MGYARREFGVSAKKKPEIIFEGDASSRGGAGILPIVFGALKKAHIAHYYRRIFADEKAFFMRHNDE